MTNDNRPLRSGDEEVSRTAENPAVKELSHDATMKGHTGQAPNIKREKNSEQTIENTIDTPSIKDVTAILSGLQFPKGKEEIYDYADNNKGRITDPESTLRLIRQIDDREYANLNDVNKEIQSVISV